MKAKLHGTYLFKDKDPAIDYLRTPRKNSGDSDNRIALRAGVAPGTVRNVFDGDTRKPQFATMVRIARAIGPEGVRALVKCVEGGGERSVLPQLKLVQGGKQTAGRKRA